MNEDTLQKEITEQVGRLGFDQQQKVLEFARSLVKDTPTEISGKSLLSFAGTIGGEDLEMMKLAIEEGCEKVSIDDW